MPMTAKSHRRPASLPNGKDGKRRRTSFGSCKVNPPGRFSSSRWGNCADRRAEGRRGDFVDQPLRLFAVVAVANRVFAEIAVLVTSGQSRLRLDLGTIL